MQIPNVTAEAFGISEQEKNKLELKLSRYKVPEGATITREQRWSRFESTLVGILQNFPEKKKWYMEESEYFLGTTNYEDSRYEMFLEEYQNGQLERILQMQEEKKRQIEAESRDLCVRERARIEARKAYLPRCLTDKQKKRLALYEHVLYSSLKGVPGASLSYAIQMDHFRFLPASQSDAEFQRLLQDVNIGNRKRAVPQKREEYVNNPTKPTLFSPTLNNPGVSPAVAQGAISSTSSQTLSRSRLQGTPPQSLQFSKRTHATLTTPQPQSTQNLSSTPPEKRSRVESAPSTHSSAEKAKESCKIGTHPGVKSAPGLFNLSMAVIKKESDNPQEKTEKPGIYTQATSTN